MYKLLRHNVDQLYFLNRSQILNYLRFVNFIQNFRTMNRKNQIKSCNDRMKFREKYKIIIRKKNN